MAKKRTSPKVTVTFEPACDIDDTALNLFCRIAFGMNLEQTVQAVRKNAGGKYDDLYEREEATS